MEELGEWERLGDVRLKQSRFKNNWNLKEMYARKISESLVWEITRIEERVKKRQRL